MRGILHRVYYALGPVGTGIILDLLDLATFGPVGLLAGAAIGGYCGWMLGRFEGFDRNTRIAVACCAALYMAIPFTEPFPVATVLGIVARLVKGPPDHHDGVDELAELPQEGVDET